MIYHWAIRHPRQVSCIYGDALAMGIRPYVRGRKPGSPDLKELQAWMKAHDLTLEKAHAYRQDAMDTAEFARRYCKWGGTIKVIVKKGGKHQPQSLKDPTPIVDFILASQ